MAISQVSNRPLLPHGLADKLPPLAACSLRSTQQLMQCFMAFGYQPVTPSMLEYTDTMLVRVPLAASTDYFQFRDPISNQTLALRADMTGQIARIATSSLSGAPRPLRLCYAGQRVRAVPEALHTRREHRQIGIEFIGASGMHAEAEVIALAEHALSSLGLKGLSLDIHLPVLLGSTLAQLPADIQAKAKLAAARKDEEALRACGADLLADLLSLRGSLADTAALLREHKSPVKYASTQLEDLARALKEKACNLPAQVDALEASSDSNYSGISFSIFSHDPAFEVARGGRYTLENGEQAVGFTLYLDDVLAYLPAAPVMPVIALPCSTSFAEAVSLQQEYITIYLDDNADFSKKTLMHAGFSHALIGGVIQPLQS